jgi:hypothetical protein
VQPGVLDRQREDEAAQEHEVGGLQVVDAHLGLKTTFSIISYLRKSCILTLTKMGWATFSAIFSHMYWYGHPSPKCPVWGYPLRGTWDRILHVPRYVCMLGIGW